MAQEQENKQAESGTGQQSPVWDSYNGEQYPFLNVDEEIKRAGFKVQFLADKPRKETPNSFNSAETDFWFDVKSEGEIRTWTFSQKSLVMELQKHKPLTGKTFEIKLVKVDDAFKEKFPNYKGKDRYTVTEVNIAPDGTAVSEESVN